eukprot:Gb_32154 [translate_table: standard]
MQQLKFALFRSWPWELLNNYKYYLFAPLVLKAAHEWYHGGDDDWFLHIIVISFLRCVIYQLWHMYSRTEFFSRKHQIHPFATDYDQIDREFHWDNYVIFQAWIATFGHVWVPGLRSLPLWNGRGVISVLILHMGPTELLYYCAHRAFHEGFLFKNYHSIHHASTRPEPSTAGTTSFLEQLVAVSSMEIPILGVARMNEASIGMLYIYLLGFDFIKFMIHSNVEVVPLWLFSIFPFLKYLLITPSYHSIHHTKMDSNYCLFMPIYDHLGGTLDKEAFDLHFKLRSKGQEQRVPDVVFLCHGVGFTNYIHIPCTGRTFSSQPCVSRWYTWICLPLTWPWFILSWILGSSHVIHKYNINELHQESWAIPRLGFQYFLPFGREKINKLIEEAILEADKRGVKVIALGGLNKNEALNGGGALFVKKHPNLRVRVVHGNTLTTSVLLHELPHEVTQVLLTGSTSKIGKAIALYLCRRRVRVMMLTSSRERFEAVKNQAAAEDQQYLVQVHDYKAGQFCKTWIIGAWATQNDQKWAPSGTHFYQFAFPKIIESRKDCTYGESSALRLPEITQGVNFCENTMPRRVVHACHAGGVVHALEGYKHHEVGAIDVDRLDVVWDAALKHGFKLVA